MRTLRLVGLSADGSRLVLADDTTRYDLAVDDDLVDQVKAARAALAAVPQAEPSSGPPTPRQVQERIRRGETAADIARSSGMPVEAVARYEGPVLAERAHHARQARRAQVGGRPVEELLEEHVQRRAQVGQPLVWDSWLVEPGTWEVLVRCGRVVVRLLWEPSVRRVSAVDEAGRRALGLMPAEQDALQAVLRPVASRALQGTGLLDALEQGARPGRGAAPVAAAQLALDDLGEAAPGARASSGGAVADEALAGAPDDVPVDPSVAVDAVDVVAPGGSRGSSDDAAREVADDPTGARPAPTCRPTQLVASRPPAPARRRAPERSGPGSSALGARTAGSPPARSPRPRPAHRPRPRPAHLRATCRPHLPPGRRPHPPLPAGRPHPPPAARRPHPRRTRRLHLPPARRPHPPPARCPRPPSTRRPHLAPAQRPHPPPARRPHPQRSRAVSAPAARPAAHGCRAPPTSWPCGGPGRRLRPVPCERRTRRAHRPPRPHPPPAAQTARRPSSQVRRRPRRLLPRSPRRWSCRRRTPPTPSRRSTRRSGRRPRGPPSPARARAADVPDGRRCPPGTTSRAA